MRAPSVLLLICLLLAGCTAPNLQPTSPPDAADDEAVPVPPECAGDGAVQTWVLWPVDPANSALMEAYRGGQVVEFTATVLAAVEEFSRLPHRAFLLRELGEGVTLLLDYQGDPPPLVVGQTYGLVAWAPPLDTPLPEPAPVVTTTAVPGLPAPLALPDRASLEHHAGYELQLFDDLGLLFYGATDAPGEEAPLGLSLSDAAGNCPSVAARASTCVARRQVLPLAARWDDAELTLYPGQDGLLLFQGQQFVLSLFRNRRVETADQPCPGYYEHRRSLRLDRVDPPPVAPPRPTATATLTATLPITLPRPTP
ncbi:MAG: hypothetical protein NZ528_12955 [Caldilineales bacterium]|nr:hypothetical protein [Caldilineales bacterium]